MKELWAMLHVENSAMDRLNLPFFYQLGAALKPITEMKVASATGFDLLIAGLGAQGHVRTLLDTYPGLAVCKASGEEFIASWEKAFEEWRKFDALPKEARKEAKPVSNAQMTAVIGNAMNFQTILIAELQTLAAYHATEKALFSTTRLVEHSETILSQGILDELPPEAKVDINQAGRCLAFDLPTAVGFHTWRAVEVVLVKYCEEFGAKPKRKDWGSYIAALKTTGADTTTLSILDQIRALHRNPTMHPEIILSIDDAIGLFGIAPSAIVAMVTDIRRHRAKVTPAPASQSGQRSNAP